MKSNSNVQVTLNIAPLLVVTSVIFSAMKLGGAITWAWWIVLMPLWLIFPLLFVFGLAAVVLTALTKK